MKIKSSWLILILVIIIFILTVYTYFLYPDSKSTTPISKTETGYQLNQEYPKNILEAFITGSEIDSERGRFKLEVNINKIFQEDISFNKEVTVLADENTVFSIYDMETKEETLLAIEDFEVGTAVVVSIKEGNDNILTEDTFTALKMTKMVK